jgi:hypothetical protein
MGLTLHHNCIWRGSYNSPLTWQGAIAPRACLHCWPPFLFFSFFQWLRNVWWSHFILHKVTKNRTTMSWRRTSDMRVIWHPTYYWKWMMFGGHMSFIGREPKSVVSQKYEDEYVNGNIFLVKPTICFKTLWILGRLDIWYSLKRLEYDKVFLMNISMSSMRYVKNQSVGHFLIHGHVLKMALVVVCCVSGK